MYMTGPTVAGTYTITFTCQPLFGSIQKVGVALVEYDDIPLYVNGNTSNPFPVSLLGYQNPDSITSLSGGVNPSVLNTGNAVWSPPANYSLTNPTYLHVVQDTEVTPAFQQASNSGVSGLVPPAWNPTLFGTTVGDGSQNWINVGSPIPPYAIPILAIGTDQAVENPSPVAPWVLRTTATFIGSIAIYDQPTAAWNLFYTASFAKVTNNFRLASLMVNIGTGSLGPIFVPLPPPGRIDTKTLPIYGMPFCVAKPGIIS